GGGGVGGASGESGGNRLRARVDSRKPGARDGSCLGQRGRLGDCEDAGRAETGKCDGGRHDRPRALAGSAGSITRVNARRLARLSPRFTRQAYSLRIDEAKPIISAWSKLSSEYVSTQPSRRSISSGPIAASGNLPTRWTSPTGSSAK